MSSTYPPQTNSDIVTSFAPLPTTWTPPAGCQSKFIYNEETLVAFDPAYTETACDPPAMTTWVNQILLNSTGALETVMSIGPIVCPDKWMTRAIYTKDPSNTLYQCCPSGYYLAATSSGGFFHSVFSEIVGKSNSVTGKCFSDVTSGMVLTYISTPTAGSVLVTATTTIDGTSSVSANDVKGWNIKYATGVSNSSNETSHSTSSHGLSGGAKAGIGICLVLLCLVGLFTGVFIWRRRKKTQDPVANLKELPSNTKRNSGTSSLLGYELHSQQSWPYDHRDLDKFKVIELNGQRLMPGQCGESPVELAERQSRAFV